MKISINDKVHYISALTNTVKFSHKQVLVEDGDEKIDIRVDYAFQNEVGSTYERLPMKLMNAQASIKEGTYDAHIFFISKKRIPLGFIHHLEEEMKEKRFIYYKIFDDKPKEKELLKELRAFSIKILEIKQDEVNFKNIINE